MFENLFPNKEKEKSLIDKLGTMLQKNFLP
jgi:hypothetical protein